MRGMGPNPTKRTLQLTPSGAAAALRLRVNIDKVRCRAIVFVGYDVIYISNLTQAAYVCVPTAACLGL